MGTNYQANKGLYQLTQYRPNQVSNLQCWLAADGGINTENCAVFLAANSENLSITDNTDLSTGDISYSIAAWLKATTAVSLANAISKSFNGTTREYGLGQTGTARTMQFTAYTAAGGTAGIVSTASGAFNLNEWFLAAAYYDAGADLVGISINGAAFTTSAQVGVTSDTTAPFRIGARGVAGVAGDFWPGSVATVGFWKRVLTGSDLTELMTAPNYSLTSAGLKTNLVAWWNLNEASDGVSAVTRADSVGANNLTDNNTVPSGTDSPVKYIPVNNDPVASLKCNVTGVFASQPTISLRPLYKTNIFGTRSAILFDGTDDYLSMNNIAAALTVTDQPFTVIAVIKKVGNTGAQTLFGLGASGSATPLHSLETNGSTSYRSIRTDDAASSVTVAGAAAPDTNGHVITFLFTGTAMAIYLDGVFDKVLTAQDVGAITMNRATLGALVKTTIAQYWNGYLAEIAIYTKQCSDLERRGVERYFSSKYSIAVGQA